MGSNPSSSLSLLKGKEFFFKALEKYKKLGRGLYLQAFTVVTKISRKVAIADIRKMKLLTAVIEDSLSSF